MKDNRSLSIIIPVYNEEKTLRTVLDAILNVDYGDRLIEIIIVNDGSKDTTKSILDSFTADPRVKVFHKENGGKGSAVIEGLKHVTGEIVIIQDADLEYDPNDIPRLVTQVGKNGARVIYGSRFMGSIEHMPITNRIANWILTVMNNVLYGKRLTDACTCYKVLDSKLAQDLQLADAGFDICNEITAKVFKNGEKIVELPIKYNSARSSKEGKKAKWWNLLKSMWAVVYYRFAPLGAAKISGKK